MGLLYDVSVLFIVVFSVTIKLLALPVFIVAHTIIGSGPSDTR